MRKINIDKGILKEFCTGCGLCHSQLGVELKANQKGFLEPELKEDDLKFCEKVCPASGYYSSCLSENIWGRIKSLYSGWAADATIRKHASSGGIITSLCCFLLKERKVDAIVQITASKDVPYATEICISETEEEVIECSGSRYSISSPLYNLSAKLNNDKRYALVGKPCDISAIKMYMNSFDEANMPIIYFLSFFCAGMPSNDAQKRLLKALDCEDVNDCESVQYRGDGWPGYARVKKKNGTINRINYEESWGKILGRDVRKICRFCLDGIGEFADVSCADYWYLNDKNQPLFNESNGRNAVFARTDVGKEILSEAEQKNYICLEKMNIEELKYVQKYQYERRIWMKSMLLGLKLCKRKTPKYDKKILKRYASLSSKKENIRRTMGIVKRVIKGKI